ncbi:TPA: glycosyltransferase family 2 protein, partial [Streptococcus suis]
MHYISKNIWCKIRTDGRGKKENEEFMKIISFTMVNNESEIIESFIRYNYNFIDEMVIIDNGCTDNTMQIIFNLIKEGYKISVYDESLEAYNQYRLDNKYLTKIIAEKNPDLIIPLDADEFLTADSNPRKLLEQLDLEKIHYVNWQWFVMTKKDDINESFIPRRMQYCFEKPVWHHSDGKPVTKCIISAKYYKKMNLKLSMGHHTVFGNPNVRIEHHNDLKFAHYRAISQEQLIYKTICYTIRDIATMENNIETAQRTNQMALIESGVDMWETAREASYSGYDCNVIHAPIDLSFCKENIVIKYNELSRETVAERVMKTGREMAVRAYNVERKQKEKKFLKPIIFVLDGFKGDEYIHPNPSNHLTILTEMYNVRGLLTDNHQIKFLKVNYRLIITPDFAKFLPHEFIVVPDTLDIEQVKSQYVGTGVDLSKIISLKEYRKEIGFIGNLYALLGFVPNMLNRIYLYI